MSDIVNLDKYRDKLNSSSQTGCFDSHVSEIRAALFDNQIGQIKLNLSNEKDLDEALASFDELKSAYKKQLDAVIDVAVCIAIESCNCRGKKT